MSIHVDEMKQFLDMKIGVTQGHMNDAKESLARFVKNKDWPLDHRWEYFVQAPDWCKESSDWIYHWDCLKHYEDKYRNPVEDNIYSNVEKYEKVSAGRIVESIMDDWEYGDNGSSLATPEDLQNMKEEFLQKNLGFITFDW